MDQAVVGNQRIDVIAHHIEPLPPKTGHRPDLDRQGKEAVRPFHLAPEVDHLSLVPSQRRVGQRIELRWVRRRQPVVVRHQSVDLPFHRGGPLETNPCRRRVQADLETVPRRVQRPVELAQGSPVGFPPFGHAELVRRMAIDERSDPVVGGPSPTPVRRSPRRIGGRCVGIPKNRPRQPVSGNGGPFVAEGIPGNPLSLGRFGTTDGNKDQCGRPPPRKHSHCFKTTGWTEITDSRVGIVPEESSHADEPLGPSESP